MIRQLEFILVLMVITSLTSYGSLGSSPSSHIFSGLAGSIELKFLPSHKVFVKFNRFEDTNSLEYSIINDTLSIICDFSKLQKMDRQTKDELYYIYKYYGKIWIIGEYLIPLNPPPSINLFKEANDDLLYYYFNNGTLAISYLSLNDSIINYFDGGQLAKNLRYTTLSNCSCCNIKNLLLEIEQIRYFDFNLISIVTKYAMIKRDDDIYYYRKLEL